MGIYPEYDGLCIKPCIPDDWDNLTVTRRFRGTEYSIYIKRGEEKGIRVDGVKLSGSLVPLSAKEKVLVEVCV